MKKLLLLTVLLAVIFTFTICVTPFAVFAEETAETLIIGGIYTYADEYGACEVTIVSDTQYSAHFTFTDETEPFDYIGDYTYEDEELSLYILGDVFGVFTVQGSTLVKVEETLSADIDYSAIINALIANDNEDIDYDALVESLKEALASEEEDAVGDWFTNNWGVILTAAISILSTILVMFGALNVFKRNIYKGDNALANAVIGTLENTKLKVNVEGIVEKQVKKVAVELSDNINKVTELSNKVEPLFKAFSTVMMYVALPIAKSNKTMTTAERLEMLTAIQGLQELLSVKNETLSEDLTAQIELAKSE